MENDKFQRWHEVAINQLGYALNLFLTLTIATLGYWFVLLTDKDFTPTSSARSFMLLSLSTLTFSGICGFACVLNRLRDFRATAQRARRDPLTETPSKEYVDELGRVTWVLFNVHVFAFAVGVVLFAIALLLCYGGKLV